MKGILVASMIALPAALAAQSLSIAVGDITYVVPAADAGEMVFSAGKTLTVAGREFNLAEITSMGVRDNSLDPNTVEVTYAGESASVAVAGNIAGYIDASVDGAYVSIIQSAEVGDDTCGEITYVLKGESASGGFYAEGKYKASYELKGLALTNPAGAAIDIQNGKRVSLSVGRDTENFLTDGAGGSHKGALVVKGHLEIKGHGSLTLKGNTSHALYAKEYITLKNASVYVTGAVKDGLNCNQYFAMESGLLDISGVGDDGMQVSFKDDADREPDDTGSISISGGTLRAESSAAASKAVKADGTFTITGGEVSARATGTGKWDATAVKTKAAACVSADGGIFVDGGKCSLSASGAGGKGFNTDSEFRMTAGEVEISTTGGIFAYVNGQIYENYTGNTDHLNSDAKSSPKGIKADGDIVIDGGSLKVTTTGTGGEGIESKSELTINNGTIEVNAYDDALNSSANMYINGGEVTAISTDNDGLDSNKNLYVNGGVVRAFGARSPECGIDANEEEGYSVVFTGGMLLAAGGGNSTPSTSESTQPYLSLSNTLKAGDTVTVKSGATELATFTVPEGYSSSGNTGGGFPGMGGGSRGGGLLISCPGLVNGTSYTVSVGTSTTTATAQLKGSSSGRPW